MGQLKVSRTTLYSIIPTTLPLFSRPGARPRASSLLWSKWTEVKDTSLLTTEQNQLQASKESSLSSSLQGEGVKKQDGGPIRPLKQRKKKKQQNTKSTVCATENLE